jgi:uncharacterized iron-regulated membrane protein
MSGSGLARVRSALWALHRWIALGLIILLVPMSVSGALLVWHDPLDALIHPSRYAVSGADVAPPSTYLSGAKAALDAGVQLIAVRFPEQSGWPVTVLARAGERTEGRPPRLLTVYLDPPTGRVLDVVDFRSSLIGFLHRFHENLTIPEYSGRAVVGWAGVGMLLLALTGIWLWWPRNGAFVPGLRWRRAAATTSNLHHLLGFWIAVPLAAVSLTGIYLSFPQNARSLMASVAPMNPQAQRSIFASEVARDTHLTPDAALDAARGLHPDARPAAVFLAIVPAGAGGRRGERGSSASGEVATPSPIWRIQLRKSDGDVVTLLVDDRSGTVQGLPAPLAGDRAAQWIRWIHEGSHSGPVWQFAVFLTGALPPVFAVTGVIMWSRRRRNRKALAERRQDQPGALQAAE